MERTVRPAAVAGRFYLGSPGALRASVRAQLDAWPQAETQPTARAWLVPHAGHVYSGPTAAAAYRQLESLRGLVRRVVLLGPSHRVAFLGIASPTVTAFETPLGEVPLDRPVLDGLRAVPGVVFADAPHAQEHSLEVQLPFLQEALGRFTLVPLVVGDASTAEVQGVLEALPWGDDTVVLISSDLSHYLPLDEARQVDQETMARVLALRPVADHERACGATPLDGWLRVARARRLQATLLDLRTSGDTAGDPDQVVGYAAVAFAPVPRG